MAPEHKRLSRYSTMTLQEIIELPVHMFAADRSHLYLWVPNAPPLNASVSVGSLAQAKRPVTLHWPFHSAT